MGCTIICNQLVISNSELTLECTFDAERVLSKCRSSEACLCKPVVFSGITIFSTFSTYFPNCGCGVSLSTIPVNYGASSTTCCEMSWSMVISFCFGVLNVDEISEL